MKQNIIIIGGGPAGLMAAGAAAEQFKIQGKSSNIMLIEANEKLGKKLYITGKGRCNVTNAVNSQAFLEKVVTNNKFLYGAINKFTTQNTIDFLQSNGVKLKVERGGRVFPESDHASDVTAGLSSFAKKHGVNILLNCKVLGISKTDNGFVLEVVDNGTPKVYKCDRLIIATGGVSYPSTGSTGDGYKFARSLGHTVSPVKPALVPIDLKDYNNDLAGVSLKNVKASVIINDKITASEFGEMLFTHTGVSGPIILTLSSLINKLKFKGAVLNIDLKPALTEQQLDARLLRDFEGSKNKDFSNYLPELLPKGLIADFISRLDFPGNKKINEITKQNRTLIIYNLKHYSFKIDALKDVSLGIITSGGIDVKEISAKDMQSKIIKNLYFAGEVIDVDAETGGYNIQIALSTGYLAGISAANNG